MKTIFFDLDGTLTDPEAGIVGCIEYALKKMEMPIGGDLSWCIGPPLQSSFGKIFKGDSNKVEKAINYYRKRFSDTGMFENEVYEGVEPMLEELVRNKLLLYVVTSKPHVYAKKIIKHFSLDKYFVQVFGSELCGERADKGDLIKYVLMQTKVNQKSTLMIGDREHDLIGAHKNKVPSMGVLWGYGSYEELEAIKPIALANSPKHLTKLILKMGG